MLTIGQPSAFINAHEASVLIPYASPYSISENSDPIVGNIPLTAM